MRVLVAPNAFKSCIGASAAAEALARGFRRAGASSVDLMPVADGGDGLVEVLLAVGGGRVRRASVTGPFGNPVPSSFALLKDGSAVIEIARASGLALCGGMRLRPMTATSRGTGELLSRALECGAGKIYVGLGGSATNDGGAGMAAALGVRFLDSRGHELPDGVRALASLSAIDMAGADRRLSGTSIFALTDVRNPLLGPRGSARVYGPQKGASPSQVEAMEEALSNYARIIRRDTGISVGRVPGSAAAGGIAAGLMAFCGARIMDGAALVLEMCGAAGRMRRADLVVTGEGSFDRQTLFGKAPFAVAKLAVSCGKPVAVVAGRIALSDAELRRGGIARAVDLSLIAGSREAAMKDTACLLEKAAFSLFEDMKKARSRGTRF